MVLFIFRNTSKYIQNPLRQKPSSFILLLFSLCWLLEEFSSSPHRCNKAMQLLPKAFCSCKPNGFLLFTLTHSLGSRYLFSPGGRVKQRVQTNDFSLPNNHMLYLQLNRLVCIFRGVFHSTIYSSKKVDKMKPNQALRPDSR